MKYLIKLLTAALLLTSCGRTLDITGLVYSSSPDANARFAVSKDYNDEYGFQTINVETDEYQVYACADAHIRTSDKGFSQFVSDYMADEEAAPFALYLGDAMEGQKVYDRFREVSSPIFKSGRTLFSTPGNHDLYFSQWGQYISWVKTATYKFDVVTPSGDRDLFICLDSASGTLGTDQKAWLEHLLTAPVDIVPYRHIIIFTHTHFFKRDNSQGHTSNFNLEETYDLVQLFKDGNVDLVLSGHDHSFDETVFKGIRFLTLAAIADKSECAYYYKIDVKQDETNWQSVRIR